MPKSLNEGAKLAGLFGAAIDALDQAHRERQSIGGAVNWGDLHVIHAEEYLTNYGERGLRVWLEEAAPDAVELQHFMSERLHRAGYPAVEVKTEW